MSQSIGLTKNLQDLNNKVDEIFERKSEVEKTIELIDKKKWAMEYVEPSLKFMFWVGYFFLGLFFIALFDSVWLINLIGAYIALVLIDNFITAPYFKGKYTERLKVLDLDFDRLEKELHDLMHDKLLLEIYPLGMMTAKNIVDKTSAKYLSVECIQEFMEKVVEQGYFEKIKLKDDILYKGRHPLSQGNFETVILDVDF